jgi:hypothetical protein
MLYKQIRQVLAILFVLPDGGQSGYFPNLLSAFSMHIWGILHFLLQIPSFCFKPAFDTALFQPHSATPPDVRDGHE